MAAAALCTSTSTGPSASRTSGTMRARSLGSARLATIGTARPPSASIAATVSDSEPTSRASDSACNVRATTATAAPSAASRRAIATPRPRLAPVTSATLPERVRAAAFTAAVLPQVLHRAQGCGRDALRASPRLQRIHADADRDDHPAVERAAGIAAEVDVVGVDELAEPPSVETDHPVVAPKLEVVRQRQPVHELVEYLTDHRDERQWESDEATDHRHRHALLARDDRTVSRDVGDSVRRAKQRAPEHLLDLAELLAVGGGHVVGRGRVETLARLQADQLVRLRPVGEEADVLLELEPGLLDEAE